MRAGLSPFGNIVCRALHEALPGIHLSSSIIQQTAFGIRIALIAYMRNHSELTIQGFGTFRREQHKTPTLRNQHKTELRITFTPVKALEKGDDSDRRRETGASDPN